MNTALSQPAFASRVGKVEVVCRVWERALRFSAAAILSCSCLQTTSAAEVAGEPRQGFQPSAANAAIQSVAAASGSVFFIGGSFTAVGEAAAMRVARILPDGTVDPQFSAGALGPNQSVVCLFANKAGNRLYLGGAFTSVEGSPRQALARLIIGGLDPGVVDGSLDPTFAPLLGGANPLVNAIVEQYDGKILVGGSFGTVNGAASANLARINPDGTLDASFIPPAPSGVVNSIALQPDGRILVGGAFTQVAGQSRRGLARLNPDGTLDASLSVGTGVGGGFNGTVNAVAVAPDGSVYVGGSFSAYSGRSFYNNLAKLSPSGVIDGRFNYSLQIVGGLNGAVNSILVRPAGQVLVAGAFTEVSNSVLPVPATPVGHVVQFQPDGALDATFNPGGAGANSTARAMVALASGDLALVGAFGTYNIESRPRMVLLAGFGEVPILTSPAFLTVNAGESFGFAFRNSSGSGPYSATGDLPRGVTFDPATGLLSGIPLDAGSFPLMVTAEPSPGPSSLPTPFTLYVLPNTVPYEAWAKVWFGSQWDNPAVAGPDVTKPNPSGLSNFAVYALNGGDPLTLGPAIAPQAGPQTAADALVYFTMTVTKYPLAEAAYAVWYCTDLATGPWLPTEPVSESSLELVMRAPISMASSKRQFLRAIISGPAHPFVP
jgi:uncharacterized delta-60 repeat protein